MLHLLVPAYSNIFPNLCDGDSDVSAFNLDITHVLIS
jgi:hypothetical protein